MKDDFASALTLEPEAVRAWAAKHPAIERVLNAVMLDAEVRGVLRFTSLEAHPDFDEQQFEFCGRVHRRILCPCGDWNCVGTIVVGGSFGVTAEIGNTVICHSRRGRWLVIDDRAAVIEQEEQRALAALERNTAYIGVRASADEAFVLWNTHGVDPDVLDIDDRDRFESLRAAHRANSSKRNRNG